MVAIAIIAWILMFMILVILHELWHFTAARKSWVKVLEFWIWIPPKICKLWKDKKWTEYTANAIPLGWFCSLKWEDPSNPEEFNAPDSFMSAKFWKKIIILLWWVTANFLVAWVLFTVVFSVWIKPTILPDNAIKWESHSLLMPTNSYLQELWFQSGDLLGKPLVVLSVSSWYLVDDLWITIWDTLLSVNWENITTKNIWLTLKNYIWQPIEIEYEREWEVLKGNAVCPEDSCILWITYNGSEVLIKYPFHKAMWMWIKEIWAEWNLTFSSLWWVLKKAFSSNKAQRQDSLNSLSGPVWIIVILKEYINLLIETGDRTWILGFMGMISLALAIFNILPIPALDGWRTLSVIIQKVFRLKKEKYFTIEWYVNTVFFIILMWLWILIIYNDFKVRVWVDLLYPIKRLIQRISWIF